MTDLVALVADGHMQSIVDTLLTDRRKSLEIRPITFVTPKHPGADPGVFREAPDFLSVYRNTHGYALVLLDVRFPGSPGSAELIERHLQEQLENRGWQGRSQVIAVAPELEEWVWCAPHHALERLSATMREVRDLARQQGWWDEEANTTTEPKELLKRMADVKRIAVSKRFFRSLAERISLPRCGDEAFVKLRQTLCAWFPQQG